MRCEHKVKRLRKPRRCKRKASWMVEVKTNQQVSGLLEMRVVDKMFCTFHTHRTDGVTRESIGVRDI